MRCGELEIVHADLQALVERRPLGLTARELELLLALSVLLLLLERLRESSADE